MMPLLLGLAQGSELRPVMMAELDALALPEAEGEAGFRLTRLYLGADAPLGSARLLGVVNFAGEHPAVLDASVGLDLGGPWSVVAGYGKTPLFASARDQSVETTPLPELSLSTRALWPGRDLGVELRVADPDLPVAVRARVGNGSGSPLGNDNPMLAADLRLDTSWGRARQGAERAEAWGLLVGVGLHAEVAEDRLGATGETLSGFTFWRAPTISGPVWLGEAHAVGLVGPVQAIVEGGWLREGRSEDTDGDPDTAREALEPVVSAGGSAELAWMMTGQHRQPGGWPALGEDRLGVEIAARGSRLMLGRGTEAIDDGGAWSGEAGARLWSPLGLALGLAGGVTAYDTPPLEEPEATLGWTAMLRVTGRVR